MWYYFREKPIEYGTSIERTQLQNGKMMSKEKIVKVSDHKSK